MLLRNKVKERLMAIFEAIDYSFEVWAFGSRVNGTAHVGSDLDLVIRTEDLHKLPFTLLSNIQETLRESNIPIIIEICDWARLPESFHKNIEAQHELLYSNLKSVATEPNPPYAEEPKA